MSATHARLPLAQIIDPEDGGKLAQEDVDRMAASLEADGQINAVVVRPLFIGDVAEEDKSYEIVAGRTRLKAARQLGWEDISAKIDELTDEQAQVQRITENLIRSSLKPAELAKQMKRWEERVSQIAPHRVGRAASCAAAGRKASQAAAKRKKAKESTEPTAPSAAESESHTSPASVISDEIRGGFDPSNMPAGAPSVEPSTGGGPEKSLKQEAMERTGLAERTIGRAYRIGKEFTEEQLDILADHEVPLALQEKLALLPDKAARDAAVRKIAMEVDAQQAFNEAKAQAGEAVEVGNDALSDDEWFESECGEVAAKLTTGSARNAYKRDALLYRQTRDIRQKLRKKMKGILDGLAKEVPGGKKGRLFRNFTLFNNVTHPKYWKVCSNCRGSGAVNSATCKDCLGDGFRVEMEVSR